MSFALSLSTSVPVLPDAPSDGGVGVAPETATADINADIREMADMVPHQMWFSAPQGGIVYINDRFYEYTGLPRNAGIGVGWRSIVHPEDLEECNRTRDEAIREAQTWRCEYRIRRHDGEYRWHIGRTLPLFDTNGALRRWVGTATDVHEEKMAAERQRTFMREVLAAVTRNRLRLCLGRSDLPKSLSTVPDEKDPNAVPLTKESLGTFRRLVMQVCDEAGLDSERAADVLFGGGRGGTQHRGAWRRRRRVRLCRHRQRHGAGLGGRQRQRYRRKTVAPRHTGARFHHRRFARSRLSFDASHRRPRISADRRIRHNGGAGNGSRRAGGCVFDLAKKRAIVDTIARFRSGGQKGFRLAIPRTPHRPRTKRPQCLLPRSTDCPFAVHQHRETRPTTHREAQSVYQSPVALPARWKTITASVSSDTLNCKRV